MPTDQQKQEEGLGFDFEIQPVSNDSMSLGGDFPLDTMSVPKSITRFRMKEEKEYRLIFIPFKLCHDCPAGDKDKWWWYLKYVMHANIGVNETRVVCPYHTREMKETCYTCGQVRIAKKAGNEPLKDAIKPRDRCAAYLLNADDLKSGLQYYEDVYFYSVVKKLEELLSKKPKNDIHRQFYDIRPGRGHIVVASVGKHNYGEGTVMQVQNVALEQRSIDIPPAIIKKIPGLKDLYKHLVFLPQTKVKQMFEEGEAEAAKPSNNGKAPSAKKEKPAAQKTESKPAPKPETPKEEEKPAPKPEDFGLEVGMRVVHASKGQGVVESFEPTKAIVKFDETGKLVRTEFDAVKPVVESDEIEDDVAENIIEDDTPEIEDDTPVTSSEKTEEEFDNLGDQAGFKDSNWTDAATP